MLVTLLRFDAPLMSFGSVMVDQINKTDLYPYRAMLVGLIANALGLTRKEVDRHEQLQRQLRYAARRDRAGSVVIDYQTVDFDKNGPMASNLGWTFEGTIEERKGGAASDGTHIRYRHYVADAIITVAFALDGATPRDFDMRTIEDALRSPARPLFLGRKCCIPSTPLFLRSMDSVTLREALNATPRVGARGDKGPLAAIWQRGEPGDERFLPWPRVEDRDWANSIHVGRRMYIQGQVDPPNSRNEVVA